MKMETIQKEIPNHHADVDVTHKINKIELDNWINQLQYTKIELSNLISLCEDELSDNLNDKSLYEKFQKKEIENENLLNALYNYLSSRNDIINCEDSQCDMIYLTVHDSYRRNYLYHLNKYQKLKNKFFNDVQGNFTLLNTMS